MVYKVKIKKTVLFIWLSSLVGCALDGQHYSDSATAGKSIDEVAEVYIYPDKDSVWTVGGHGLYRVGSSADLLKVGFSIPRTAAFG